MVKTGARNLLRRLGMFLIYLPLIAIAFVLAVPTVTLVVNSFRTDMELGHVPTIWIPQKLTLENYARIFRYDVMLWIWNSVFVAVTSTALSAIVTLMAGYAFAKKPIPFKEAIFWTLIGALMIPATVTFVPMFVLMVRLHLVNTLWGLILPSGLSIGYLFYLRQYLIDLPDSFLDSAAIDGCSELGIFFRIVLPVCAPAVWTIVMLSFLGSWNSFLWPLMILYDSSKFTLPLGIQQVIYDDVMNRSGIEFEPNFGLQMAGGACLMLPGVIMFTLFHKGFIGGLWGGLRK